MKAKLLIIASSVAAACVIVAVVRWNRHGVRPSPPQLVSPKGGALGLSAWKRYADNQYGFELEYPPEYQIGARVLNGQPYDEEFSFSIGPATPLRLRLINLRRYLEDIFPPLTRHPFPNM